MKTVEREIRGNYTTIQSHIKALWYFLTSSKLKSFSTLTWHKYKKLTRN